MEVYKRRQAILALLEEQEEVSVEDLSIQLKVSANTIRNDLNAMDGEKLLRRIRGGAVALKNHPTYNKAFAGRAHTHRTAKEQMGRWAASLVDDGDALVLDASSTVFHLATFLQDLQDLTVVTNGLEVALLLAQNPSNKVLLAANVVRPDGFSMIGRLNPDLSQRFYASKCFVSCSGFALDQGLTEVDVDEAPLKSEMIKLARQVIALVDHTKFDRIDTYRFAELKQIDHLVTDEGIAADHLNRLRQAAHFPITIASPTGVETLEPGQPAPRPHQYRIGFGNLTEKMVFAQQVRRSLERAAKRLDNIELLVRDNNLDRQLALENADWFVSQNVDLLIEYQLDAQAGNIIMDKFKQANIPVIAVDIPLPGATFFGADNYRAGRIAGEAMGRWVQDHWQGRLDVLLKLEAPRVGPVAGARIQGQQEGLESVIGPLDSVQIMAIDSPVLIAETELAIESLLPSIAPEAKVAIITINDDAVLGALNAFERANRLNQVVAVGQNTDRLSRAALRRVNFPFIGSTRYAPEKYGEKLLDLAVKILNGQPVPPAVYTRHVFITRDNIDEYYPDIIDTDVLAAELSTITSNVNG